MVELVDEKSDLSTGAAMVDVAARASGDPQKQRTSFIGGDKGALTDGRILRPGTYFGEKALLCGEKWPMSVFSSRGGCMALTLPGGLFRGLGLQYLHCEACVANVPLFKLLPKKDKRSLIMAMGTSKWDPGETLIKQGDEGNEFF